jgi:hypothetical protein
VCGSLNEATRSARGQSRGYLEVLRTSARLLPGAHSVPLKRWPLAETPRWWSAAGHAAIDCSHRCPYTSGADREGAANVARTSRTAGAVVAVSAGPILGVCPT